MYDLRDFPKAQRSQIVIETCLRKDGTQWRFLDEDELTEEYLKIAVNDNGFIYPKLPEKYQTKQLLCDAIMSTGGMVVTEYMSGRDFDEDVQYILADCGCGYLFSVSNITQKAFDYVFEKEYRRIIQYFVDNIYKEIKYKFLQERHVINYFHKQAQYGNLGHVRLLHMLVPEVTIELMLEIYDVAPHTYEHFKTVEGFDNSLRCRVIDTFLQNTN